MLKLFGSLIMFCAISIIHATSCQAAARANPVTNFVISGINNSGGFGADPWVGCGQCTLYSYKAANGKLAKIGLLSDDASMPIFAYVAGSVSYDADRNSISFIASTPPEANDYDDYAAIYTVDASTGHTLFKTPWDVSKYGRGQTIIPAD